MIDQLRNWHSHTYYLLACLCYLFGALLEHFTIGIPSSITTFLTMLAIVTVLIGLVFVIFGFFRSGNPDC